MTGDTSTGGTERTEDGIEITVEARIGDSIEGWEESRDDLGLGKHGEPVAGVELVHEEPHYWDDADEYPHGYGPVTLRFPDVESLDKCRDHLRDKATERFEWGADGEAVQDFLSLLPTAFEVEQSLQAGKDRNGGQTDE